MTTTVFVVSEIRWTTSSIHNFSRHVAVFFKQKDAVNYIRFQNMEVGRSPSLLLQEAILFPSGDLEAVITYY
jgi:hypothetical protein